MVCKLFAKTYSPSRISLCFDSWNEASVTLSKPLVGAILIACATAKDADLAVQLFAKVELHRSDNDLCSALIKVHASCAQSVQRQRMLIWLQSFSPKSNFLALTNICARTPVVNSVEMAICLCEGVVLPEHLKPDLAPLN